MTYPVPALTWETFDLTLHHPFHIAHGTSTIRQAFWLRLAGDCGWGEGTIPPYYGIETTAMTSYWSRLAQSNRPFPDDLAGIADWVGDTGPAPARCAVDLALHDRLARCLGVPLHQLLDLPQPTSKATSFTIGMDTPEAMARMASKASAYPILKIKLGGDGDAARVAAIRNARPDAELCVDANGGWPAAIAVPLIEQLLPYRLSFVEQPTPANDINALGYVQARIPLPVVADESLRTPADLEALANAGVRGINVKLMKLGGLTPALRLIRRARELGMRIMLGCMIETSLGVTAVAHLCGMADWLDLDAPLLIANDPFSGVRFDNASRLHLPQRPGIGVVRRPAPRFEDTHDQ